jgi:hypothetical protein
LNSNKKSSVKTETIQLENNTVENNEFENLHLHSVTTNNKDWLEKIVIKNKTLEFKLDSGAQCDVIPLNIAKELNLDILPSETRNIISYNNVKNKVSGDAKTLVTVLTSQKK